MQKENLVELSGTVETVVYKNEESGFAVLELDHDGELVTVVGELASVGEGEMLTLHGSFRTHPNYGTQFKAVAAQQRLPASASAILRYLSSGAIKGIGAATSGISAVLKVFSGIGLVIGGAITAVKNFINMFQNGFSVVKDILMGVGIAL